MVLSTVRRSTGLVVALALTGAACGDDEESTGDADRGPYVVATTSIWADVVGLVACDGALPVRALVPPGGDAHAYEPSLQDRETLDGAALVVANGLGLEELLEDTLDEVAAGTPVFVIADHLTPLGDDPHVWFDPTRVAAALPALADALVEAGADRAAIDACRAEAEATLRAVDEEVATILRPIPTEDRLLVTNHDALEYFADRYDLEVLGTVLPSTSTLVEASPGQLEALADQIEATGVPAIFTESLHGSADAEALADRLGVDVVELVTDALGEPGSEADTYVDLLRTDARRIADALG